MLQPILLEIEIGLKLQSLKFRSEELSQLNQAVPFILLGVIVLGSAVMIFFYLRRKGRMEEMARVREEARARLLISEFNLTDEDLAVFQAVTGTASTRVYIPMLENRDIFERAMKDFRLQNPKHPALNRLADIRQRLGYGFGNARNPFHDTRMLAVGSRVQCRIPRADKDVSYPANILATNESHLYIRAPIARGKPVTLPKVAAVMLKIRRDEDADYEITTPLLGQTRNEAKALILEHTTEIQKLAVRNTTRTVVNFESRFYVVKKEVAKEKAHSKFRATDSQFSFNGHVKDLSIGGALVVVATADHTPEVGDWVVFLISEAQIKEELAGEVVRLTPLGEGNLQVHLRFKEIKEINRLKMVKYLQRLQATDGAPPAKAPPPPDTATDPPDLPEPSLPAALMEGGLAQSPLQPDTAGQAELRTEPKQATSP